MTKKTKKAVNSNGPRHKPATGRSPETEELDELPLFQETEYDEYAEEHHHGRADLDVATDANRHAHKHQQTARQLDQRRVFVEEDGGQDRGAHRFAEHGERDNDGGQVAKRAIDRRVSY